jgi:hypothetical protein
VRRKGGGLLLRVRACDFVWQEFLSLITFKYRSGLIFLYEAWSLEGWFFFSASGKAAKMRNIMI